MLEERSDPSAFPLVFRAPLFRVQRGLRVGFATRRLSARPERPSKAALALALGYRYLQAVEWSDAQDFAALAQKLKVSRAWVSMRVKLTFLAPKIQEAILLGTSRLPSIQELVRIAMFRDWSDQLDRWHGVDHGSGFPSETRGK